MNITALIAAVIGILTFIAGLAALVFTVAAWVTHVIACIKVGAWVLLAFGCIVAPVGVIHGVDIWLGVF